ncbi:M23 family metallopeptidase [Amphibacillus sp. MSJ-3]|uniref:M23 family metallopeptidase n=1 Tax=Amphibacillus sp. MSJ-3 TaxID=2841505 RepID=UPI001C0ED4E7|nr:M23 family metallopeptidase [Amphibacillus sp. MSJ-3]MBU5593594.1 M23 family metallopeptidase [Amphibacillus sp. MSJ-3]
MRRDLNEVRKSLAKRKAIKLKALERSSKKQSIKPIAAKQVKQKQNDTEQQTPYFVKQIIMAGFLFLLSVVILQFIPTSSQTRQWLASQLNDEFPFATVNVWYQKQFGIPLGFFVDQSAVPVTNQQVLPVNGVINESFDTNGQGVIFKTIDQQDVFSIDQGTVLFAGNDRETGKTVVIQHPNQTKSTYGFLTEINVRPYQFVQASQQIGTSSNSKTEGSNLYFSIQKGNQFLDPFEVITVNDPK